MSIKQGTKRYKWASFSLFLAGFVTFSTLYTTQPLMPIFAKQFHVSAPVASITLSISTGLLAIVMLIAASMSDVFGKKKLMVISMFLTSFLGLLTSLSPNFIVLVLLRALLGIFIAGVPSIAMGYVSEEFDSKAIGKVMGLYICGTSMGGMAGRILTSILTDLFNWRIALAIIGILTLLFSFLFWKCLPSPRYQKKREVFNRASAWQSYKVHFSNKKLMLLILLPFLLMGSFVTLYNYIGFLLVEPPYSLSQTLTGFIFLVYLCGSFSSVYMGKKAGLNGRRATLKKSITIMAAGSVLTLLPSLVIKVIGIAIFTFGFFGSHSIASAWVGDEAKVNKVQASSLYLLFYYLGSSLLGSFGGYFWVHFHWIGIVAFICSLLSIGYTLVFLTQKQKKSVSSYCKTTL